MPRGDDRLPKIVCGLDFYISGRKIDRFYVSLHKPYYKLMTNNSFSLFPKRIFIGVLLLTGALQGLKAQQPWYVGVQGGTAFGQCTMRSITEHQVHWGAQGGVFGGYRFNGLFSLEAAVQYGMQSQYALDCCPYWLSESMNRYFAPVTSKNGWYYSDLEGKTQWGKLSLQTNFDLVGLFAGPDARWSLIVAPEVAAVTTSTRLVAPNKEIQFDRQWHAGLGGEASIGFNITPSVGAALYADITCLTGDRFDNMPEHAHKSNLIYDTGLKLSFSLGKARTQKAAPQSTTSSDDEAARLAAERERAERERRAAEQAAREREIAAALAREQAEREAAAAAAEKERAFNTPIPTVYFSNNSSIIERAYVSQLEEALAILERYPDFKLEIHAYSSVRGDKAYNELLSKGRMEEICDWFTARGISAERLGNAYYHGVDYKAPTEAEARRAELKFVK